MHDYVRVEQFQKAKRALRKKMKTQDLFGALERAALDGENAYRVNYMWSGTMYSEYLAGVVVSRDVEYSEDNRAAVSEIITWPGKEIVNYDRDSGEVDVWNSRSAVPRENMHEAARALTSMAGLKKRIIEMGDDYSKLFPLTEKTQLDAVMIYRIVCRTRDGYEQEIFDSKSIQFNEEGLLS